MSLTQTHHVFVGVSETGINTFLKALFASRPHYLNYGSTLFVATTTVNATNMAPIAFPGVPGGVQWAVSFSTPTVDIFPDSSGGASPLPPVANTFSAHTKVTISIGCLKGTELHERKPQLVPLQTTLEVWALGEILSQFTGPGTGVIQLKVDRVLLPSIQPASLEAVLECLVRMLLSAVLQSFSLPFHALSLGTFALVLEQGPELNDNQIKVWGSI